MTTIGYVILGLVALVVVLFYAALLAYCVGYTWTRGQYDAFQHSYTSRKIPPPAMQNRSKH